MEAQKEKAVAFLFSAVVTIIIVGSIILVHEQDTAFKAFLNSLTGHHWLTKSVFAAVLFPALSTVFYFAFRSGKGRKLLKTSSIGTWAAILVATVTVLLLASLINYTLHYFAI